MRKIFMFLGLVLGLVGCAERIGPQTRQPAGSGPTRPDANHVRFGVWQVDRGRCEAVARLPEMQLRTDGRLDRDQRLRLEVTLGPALRQRPAAELTGLTEPLLLEGPAPQRPVPGQRYVLWLPYQPAVLAPMLAEDNYLVIWYRPVESPAGETLPRSQHVQTAEMLTAVASLSRACPD